MQVKIQQMDKSLPLPYKATSLSAGFDIHASIPNGYVWIDPGQIVLIGTGLKMEIDEGYEVQIRPRSGLACKYGVTVINSPGTIDADYRGEVKVALINHGMTQYKVRHGDRIAQMVIAPVIDCTLIPVQSLSGTEREEGGFGHTGK